MLNDDSPLLKYLIVGAIVGVTAYFVARPYFIRASDMEWDRTVATYPDQGPPQAYVHGRTNAPLEQCRFSLLWKAGEDKWLVYELDAHGATWDRYQLRQDGDNALGIIVNGKPAERYDVQKGELTHLASKQTDKTPTAVIHGTSLEHEAQWVYYSAGK